MVSTTDILKTITIKFAFWYGLYVNWLYTLVFVFIFWMVSSFVNAFQDYKTNSTISITLKDKTIKNIVFSSKYTYSMFISSLVIFGLISFGYIDNNTMYMVIIPESCCLKFFLYFFSNNINNNR